MDWPDGIEPQIVNNMPVCSAFKCASYREWPQGLNRGPHKRCQRWNGPSDVWCRPAIRWLYRERLREKCERIHDLLRREHLRWEFVSRGDSKLLRRIFSRGDR